MRALRILTWHIHGSYLYYLTQTPCIFYLPYKNTTEEGYGARTSGFPWGDNVISVPAEKDKVQDLCDQLSLSGLTGLLSFADIVISNDTGPLHLARALQTVTIGIFLCGNIINALPLTTSFNRNLLSWTMHCPLCGISSFKFNETKSNCKHDTSFVAEITVDEARETIKELLDVKKTSKLDLVMV